MTCPSLFFFRTADFQHVTLSVLGLPSATQRLSPPALTMELKVVKAGDGPAGQELAMTNKVYVSAADHGTLGSVGGSIYLECAGFVFLATSDGCQIPLGAIGLNSVQRRLVKGSLGDLVTVSVFQPKKMVALSSAAIEVDFVVKKAGRTMVTVDGPELSAFLTQRFGQQYLTTGQQFAAEFQGNNYVFTVASLEAVAIETGSGDKVGRGMLVPQTQLLLSKAAGTPIQLSGLETQSRSTMFKADFSFEKMGIGGLDKEFSDIFRRAFASRVFPAAVIKKMQVCACVHAHAHAHARLRLASRPRSGDQEDAGAARQGACCAYTYTHTHMHTRRYIHIHIHICVPAGAARQGDAALWPSRHR